MELEPLGEEAEDELPLCPILLEEEVLGGLLVDGAVVD